MYIIKLLPEQLTQYLRLLWRICLFVVQKSLSHTMKKTQIVHDKFITEKPFTMF